MENLIVIIKIQLLQPKDVINSARCPAAVRLYRVVVVLKLLDLPGSCHRTRTGTMSDGVFRTSVLGRTSRHPRRAV
jgi:hypothetical protein